MPPPPGGVRRCPRLVPMRCRAARQMKMRSTIARALASRVCAKSNGFALLLPAIGVTAIARLEICERKMARIDLDTAELDGLRAPESRHRRDELGRMVFARSARLGLWGFRRGAMLGQILGAVGAGNPHSPGAA